MKKVRIGKDFSVVWSIFRKTDEGREPYEIDADSVILRLVTPYRREEVRGYAVDGNVVTWTFRGRDQRSRGVYALELVERNGKDGMVTVDKCRAFELVAHTFQESGNDCNDVVVQTVMLESDIKLAPYMNGGGVDPEQLEAVIGLSIPHDMNDDFNEDFAI